MAANSENSSRPSLESFRLCVQSICPKFNVSSLKESQFQALYSFICGEEVFVNLPTGSGKSLIFQLAPLVHTWMHEHVSAIHWFTSSVWNFWRRIADVSLPVSLFVAGREWEAAVFAGYNFLSISLFCFYFRILLYVTSNRLTINKNSVLFLKATVCVTGMKH